MLQNPGPLCPTCPSFQASLGVRRITSDGRGNSGILLVGDSPWKDEIQKGIPFAGAAGSYLDKLIRQLGRKREDFLISNTMWCKPVALNWTDKPEAQPVIDHCSPYLDELVARHKPKVIIPLGNVALRRCCGVSGILSRQAYVHTSVWNIPAVPTFHPSFLMQGKQNLMGAAAFAFKRAEQIAKAGGSYQRTQRHYLLDPPLAEARSYMFGSGQEVALDIETPKSSKVSKDVADEEDDSYTIVRVGFSNAPGTAISMSYSEPYISLIREFLASPRTWILWNENYDIPRLRFNGHVIGGEIIDAMWCWHFLQSDLPKALDFVAPFFNDIEYWSDQADAQPAYYNACDNDATLGNFIGTKQALEKQGRWQAFMTHCQQTGAILRRMGPRGILIDKVKQTELKLRLEAEHATALARLQTEVPEAVKKVKTWKRGPKEVTKDHIVEEILCPNCQTSGLGK